VLCDNADIMVDAKANNIVKVELPHKDILKAFSMFYDHNIICSFAAKLPTVNSVSK
jgi:hypothetical protein